MIWRQPTPLFITDGLRCKEIIAREILVEDGAKSAIPTERATAIPHRVMIVTQLLEQYNGVLQAYRGLELTG
jgi:hypothetical protein